MTTRLKTLKMILEWYDTNRVFLKMSKEKVKLNLNIENKGVE